MLAVRVKDYATTDTSLVTSYTTCLAASICSVDPLICTVLSVDVSPGGKCRGITLTKGNRYHGESCNTNCRRFYYYMNTRSSLFLHIFMVSPPLQIIRPTLLLATFITKCSTPATCPVILRETMPEPSASASQRTSLINYSALEICSGVPTSSTPLVREFGSESMSRVT